MNVLLSRDGKHQEGPPNTHCYQFTAECNIDDAVFFIPHFKIEINSISQHTDVSNFVASDAV